MKSRDSGADGAQRVRNAEKMLANFLEEAGWQVSRQGARPDARSDLIAFQGETVYVVEMKVAGEGRSDRLIPLWSQAFLQARGTGEGERRPMVVVAAPRIASRTADQIMAFIAEFAPEAAAGVFDFTGLRRFRGPHLESLDSDPHSPQDRSVRGSFTQRSAYDASSRLPAHHAPTDIFSDLNQWMLKVLLAPEIPASLLTAPRDRYRDAAHLARGARVSAMSASRLVRQLNGEGYLDAGKPYLTLVRRNELLRRWQASLDKPVKELPMRFLLAGDPKAELGKVLKKGDACLALFAAAEALHFGFVGGVPSYVYVPRLDHGALAGWRNLVPTEVGEKPDVIVRQAPAVQSIFRGVVSAENVPVSDILQVWLDVSFHPSRGQEQADLIRRQLLAPILEADDASG